MSDQVCHNTIMRNFFSETLQKAGARLAPADNGKKFLLDKNEQSQDVDPALKHRLMECLMQANWNRYPSADNRDIEEKIGEYCGISGDNIVLSSGSASIITTLLDFFALNHKHIVITQPSYSLFDYHCKTHNISYTPWMLNEELNFAYDNIPDLGSDSVLIITSPNNPTGNSIAPEMLEKILIENPDSMIILDGVYTEFSKVDFTPLVQKFENLIVLRSFSKAFPIAGLRLGYLCAAAPVASAIRKLMLMFSINHFSLLFARHLLFDEEFMAQSKDRVMNIIQQRDNLSKAISSRYSPDLLKVYPSEGNFLLIRIADSALLEGLLAHLSEQGIKVLNTSNFQLLDNTFRVSIGTQIENKAFLLAMCRYLDSSFADLQPLNMAR